MISITYSFPYIAVFLFLCMCAIPATTGKNRFVNTFGQKYALFAALTVFVGLRGFIYSDWRNYYPFYISIPTLFDGKDFIVHFLAKSSLGSFEKGFILFSILIKTISDNYFFYQFVLYLIDFIVLHAFFKTYIPDEILLGFVFFYVFNGVIGYGISINLLRNAKGLLLFLISLPYLQKRKMVAYFLLNGVGMLFHISSVFYIPLYFVLRKRLNHSFYIFIFIIGNIVYLLQIHFLSGVLKSVSSIAFGHTAKLLDRYIGNEKWNSSYGISIGYLERVFTYILILYFSKRLYKKESNIILVNCLYLYILSYLYFSEMRIFTDRLPLLFAFAYWVIYPQIYSFLSKDRKVAFWGIFVLYTVLKIAIGTNSIEHLYDNALFLKYSFQERSAAKLNIVNFK